MESQKIINFLESDDDNEKYCQTRKWYIINDQNNGQYQENSTIKFNTEVIKPNFCDYSDTHILVTCNIKITGGNENTKFCFKDTPFTRCVLHLNDTHIEAAENLELVMKHYNLIEYSDNYQGTFGSLYQFRRNEQPLSDAGNIAVVTSANSSSFKYKSNFFRGLNSEATAAAGGVHAYITFKNAQILVPVKYVSAFFRSSEIPLINAKIHLELSWKSNCVMSQVGENGNNDTNAYQITKTELYIPVATLNTDDNKKLSALLKTGLKRPVF